MKGFKTMTKNNETIKTKNGITWFRVSNEENFDIYLAEKAVASKAFNEKSRKTYWNSSSLKFWLEQFLDNSFTGSEKESIIKICIPTVNQIIEWFPVRQDRKCYASEGAMEDGISLFEDSNNACTYWLQDTGRRDGLSSTIVLANGVIYKSAYMAAKNVGVRPYIVQRR